MSGLAVPELALVLPVFNEGAGVGEVLAEWHAAFDREDLAVRVIVVDDGSSDDTADVLERWRTLRAGEVEVIRQLNRGHGSACRTGYLRALATGAPWVLQIDSDGQCRPEDFAALWWRREGNDVVFGNRRSRRDGAARAVVSTVCSAVATLVAGRRIRDANVPFRLIRREALAEALVRIGSDIDLVNVALAVMLRRGGWRWADVAIDFPPRRMGTGSLGLSRILVLAGRFLRQLPSLLQ